MTEGRKRIVPWAVAAVTLLVGLGAGGVALVYRMVERSEPAVPELDVPASFVDARRAPGHLVHLGVEDVTCGDCHERAQGELGPAGPAACRSCHDETHATLHAGVEGASAPECTTCHAFTAAGPAEPGDCVRCHDSDHADHGDMPSLGSHAGTECTGCHRPHATPSLEARSCSDCHASSASWHHVSRTPGTTPGGGAADCLACHRVHGEEPFPDGQCETCHRAHEPRVQVKKALFSGHNACTDCHAPHEGGGPVTRSCRDCHDGTVTLAAATVDAHRECTSCHRPHDVRGGTASRCASCHGGVSSDHPATDGPCTSCHVPHPERGSAVHDVAVACGGCHGAASETAFHAGGLRCTGCHAPHDFVLAKTAASCTGCHGSIAELAGRTRGHQECRGCHTAASHHPTRPTKPCGSCHEVPRRTAPAGHRTCLDCHRSHDGAARADATCAGCHRDAARTTHAPPRVECSQCHRPHGPTGPASPPRCATCHTTGELPGLHAEADHRSCVRCHDAHETAPRADRATCTAGCHQDLGRHEPQARSCAGCHVFGASRRPR